MNKEYETGYTMGQIKGSNDSELLVPPYCYTDGIEVYKYGYKNGYLMGYVKGLSYKLKNHPNEALQNLISERLDEVSKCMKLESKQK